jgi:hypothetical protein
MTQDLFICIALLNSLSDFLHLRPLITHDLFESTASALCTSSCIFTLLKNEQRIIASDQKWNNAIAPASQTTTPEHVSTFSNCKKPGHRPNYCIAPGGGQDVQQLDDR